MAKSKKPKPKPLFPEKGPTVAALTAESEAAKKQLLAEIELAKHWPASMDDDRSKIR